MQGHEDSDSGSGVGRRNAFNNASGSGSSKSRTGVGIPSLLFPIGYTRQTNCQNANPPSSNKPYNIQFPRRLACKMPDISFHLPLT